MRIPYNFYVFVYCFSKQAKAVLKADRLVGRALMHFPHRIHSVLLGVLTSTSILHTFAHLHRNAFVLVYLHLKRRNLVEQCIKCTEWANPFAERSPRNNTLKNSYRNQHNKFPRKQFSQCRTDTFVDCRKWQRTLKHTLRTYYICKKYGSPIPKIIYYEHR